mmetsp:Transcript_76087/g.184005  ORF Transcript_76087/g.184005 Transcript_76087/m.184005 type:complete len:214 (-) Transcript_76087:4858-5499(-)
MLASGADPTGTSMTMWPLLAELSTRLAPRPTLASTKASTPCGSAAASGVHVRCSCRFLPCRLFSSWELPDATTLPSTSTTMESQRLSTSSMWWLQSTPANSPRHLVNASHMLRRALTSTPAEISSSSTTALPLWSMIVPSMASAAQPLRPCPPDSSAILAVARSPRSNIFSVSSTARVISARSVKPLTCAISSRCWRTDACPFIVASVCCCTR